MRDLEKTLKRLTIDKKISGKHPLLSLNPKLPLRISYFQGIVLAAVVDDGQIAQMEKEYLRRLGISLNLSSQDVEECFETIFQIRTTLDEETFLQELAQIFTDKAASVLFLGDFITISMMPDHNKEKLEELAKAFAEYLDISNVANFFLKLFTGEDVDKKSCPVVLLPYLDYFCKKKETKDSLKDKTALEELKKLVNSPKFEDTQQVIQAFLSKYQDYSLAKIQQIFLPCVEQQFAVLKKAIISAKGEKKAPRFMVDLDTLEAYKRYIRYICFLDSTITKNPDFYLTSAVDLPTQLYWTEVKTPEKEAKEKVIEHLAIYIEELEHRIK